MPIVYPLSLPAVSGFVEFAWQGDSSVQVQRNEFTSASKVYAWDGQLRKATAKVGPLMSLVDAKRWQAFFLALNGQEGTFLLQDPVGYPCDGLYDFTGAPKVNGASQQGSDVVTDGWPPSVQGLLAQGDWIAIQNRLYQLLYAASSDATGHATLALWPFARGELLDNVDILVGGGAFGLFRLTEWPEFAYDVEKIMPGISFTVIEAN